MSQAEIERFVAAVRATPELMESYRTAGGPAELAGRLRAGGYDVTEEELAAKLADTADGADLSDEELDGVAGGSRVRSMQEVLRWAMY